MLTSLRRRRSAEPFDERVVGGVCVADLDGGVLHGAPPPVAESIRYLVSRIQLEEETGLPVRIAVTSAVAGEGVTYVARTLAAVVAHDLGRRVCLVDLDWWSASRQASDESVPSMPNEPSAGGVADVARGDADVDAALVPTGEPGLALVTAGRVDAARRAAMVRSGGLDRALDELADRFDHLVVELPPVLATADAITLMRVCDRFLFVVRHGVTPEHVARDALERMSGASCLGVVLNRASTRVPRVVRRLMGG